MELWARFSVPYFTGKEGFCIYFWIKGFGGYVIIVDRNWSYVVLCNSYLILLSGFVIQQSFFIFLNSTKNFNVKSCGFWWISPFLTIWLFYYFRFDELCGMVHKWNFFSGFYKFSVSTYNFLCSSLFSLLSLLYFKNCFPFPLLLSFNFD